jgi:hypothetical protein
MRGTAVRGYQLAKLYVSAREKVNIPFGDTDSRNCKGGV